MNTSRLFTLFSALVISAASASLANLLKNPGLEESGTETGSALNWNMNDPDDHGDAWGNAIRADWRAHEGKFIGVVRGTWAGMGDHGGFWQEAEAKPGVTYKASAWFWADGGWKAEAQELKLEFWNSDRTEIVGSETIALHDVGEIWVQKELEAIAPENTGWVRVVVHVSGAGDAGALQADEFSLEAAQ